MPISVKVSKIQQTKIQTDSKTTVQVALSLPQTGGPVPQEEISLSRAQETEQAAAAELLLTQVSF